MNSDQLDAEGWLIIPGGVHPDTCRAARRRLNLEVRSMGIKAHEINNDVDFFPGIREAEEFKAVTREVLYAMLEPVEIADLQLLMRWPDWEDHWNVTPHVDDPPPWYPQGYRWIAGVALTHCGMRDGAVAVWPKNVPGDFPVLIEQRVGDILVMAPDLRHAGTLNHGPDITMKQYIRALA